MFNADFLKLYEELTNINEDIILDEANGHDYGKYKKAFVNLLHGVWYKKKTDDEKVAEKEANKKANKSQRVKQGKLVGRDDNISVDELIKKIRGTQYYAGLKDEHDIHKIAAYLGVSDTIMDNNIERKRTVQELAKAINDKLNKQYRVTASGKEKDAEGNLTGANRYTVYKLAPAVLHHINGEHDDNIAVKQFTYFNKDNEEKSTYLADLDDDDTKNNLGNYVLIEASTPRNATYAHMLLHLLALVAKAIISNKDSDIGIDNPLIRQIAEALDGQLKGKNVKFTYIDKDLNKKVCEGDKALTEFAFAEDGYNAQKPLVRLMSSTPNIPTSPFVTEDPADSAEEYEIPDSLFTIQDTTDTLEFSVKDADYNTGEYDSSLDWYSYNK